MIQVLLLIRADPDASLRIAAYGEGGAASQVATIRTLGGEVEGQWALLGHYDLAVMTKFPSHEIAEAYCLIANASGYACDVHIALSPSALAAAQQLVTAAYAGNQPPTPPQAPPEPWSATPHPAPVDSKPEA